MSRDALLRQSDEIAARQMEVDETEMAKLAMFLAQGLESLRLVARAMLEPDEQTVEAPPLVWASVELFGHQHTEGLVCEVEAYGRRWLQVEQPEIVSSATTEQEAEVVQAARAKRYHPNAVYALEEADEEQVMNRLRRAAGLYRWRDGTWRRERESVIVDLDMAALADREDEDEEDLF